MADGVKGATIQLATDIGETIIKPVTDEIGKALETGVSTVIHGPQQPLVDPKIQAQKKVDEEKRRQWALRVIDWNKKLTDDAQKIRMQNQQKKIEESQVKQQEEQVKQYKVEEKKKQTPSALAVRNTTESRKGVGG
ncbi:hypothetical protein A3H85_01855 [Candidatus Daviesbacteria bacterium RIFCSPLOWO2_02_FULL_40_8]|uniref:Uncharacterized protein n=1 Tax=Candidatus Daviesbacteria bacterium RIFCSPLOWO2_01_FULL_40_24 TaxID=1797787 RepID=A0A1F5MJI9_9BACT|nr:MAG: hypothetical protein A2780_02660 [Candidatus Daviesbacteria bacterium RIFCSPHIGHO2_01_FULL_41_45]OGE35441.1 MAG: hypothetical protein A3C32_03235 [Candidatus Daviesbacteria bacterium RIFCSPHIGHO2_02_FULL_41_14]OGE65531.1 MAG: hypothetical protein A3B49_01815 [Candidatus Daviesbacteria bacterium RIFCSPLOWO2_01_FULL_40_24]OGE67094.1 MAG: hypothetical protein A3H85_01855 [Candidatus Daviesbacteria bacterium RIFCSPLOWO2_02_FULL_40_8]